MLFVRFYTHLFVADLRGYYVSHLSVKLHVHVNKDAQFFNCLLLMVDN